MNIRQSFFFGILVVATSSQSIETIKLTDAPIFSNFMLECLDSSIQKLTPTALRSAARPVPLRLSRSIKYPTPYGDLDLASRLSLQNFCVETLNDVSIAFQLDSASKAIEDALDARHLDVATKVLARIESLTREKSNELDETLSIERLHAELAKSRLMSFEDDVDGALKLRHTLAPQLDTQFGPTSNEALINRVRICDLNTEKGNLELAARDLEKLKSDISKFRYTSIYVDYLLSEAIATNLALSGNENEALAELNFLRERISERVGERSDWVIQIDKMISEILARQGKNEEALEVASRTFLARTDERMPIEPAQLRYLWTLSYLYFENGRYISSKQITDSILKTISTRMDRFPKQLFIETLSVSAGLDAAFDRFEAENQKRKLIVDNLNNVLGSDSADTLLESANYGMSLRRVGKETEGCALLASVFNRVSEINSEDMWSVEYARSANLGCEIERGGQLDVDGTLDSYRSSWERISEHDGNSSLEALTALGSYAKACLSLGRRADAKAALVKLVEQVESVRDQYSEGSDARRETFSKWVEARQTVDGPLAGYRQLALLNAQDNELESALRVSEFARDRALGDRFAEQAWRREYLPADARSRLDGLIERIQDLDERIAVAGEVVTRVRLEAERTLTVSERGRLEGELRAQLHLPPAQFRLPTLDDLRERLATDTALVSVVHSSESWWALVVRRGLPARFVPFVDPDIGRNAAAWVRQMRGDPVRAWPMPHNRLRVQLTRPDGAVGAYLPPDELGRRLSSSLLAPLEPALRGVRHVVFVGDDELVGVPLQALPRGAGLALDRYEISYAPSLATYSRWQGRAAARDHPRELLAIGAVDIASGRQAAGELPDDPLALGMQMAGTHPLPYARAEIEGIAALFPVGSAEAWTGAHASKIALREASRSGELAQYRYVHFATHAWASADAPESSAIALGDAGNAAPALGALTAAELAGLRMGAELIVLSACDTGLGRFEHGRGLLGLAFASLAAGNRAALLSLWPVADDTTAQFMQSFYRRLRNGSGPVEALTSTQREFRASKDPRRADPIVWAPFVIYGGY